MSHALDDALGRTPNAPKEEGAEDLKEQAAAAKEEDAAEVVGKKGEKQQQKKNAAELSWPIKCSAGENCSKFTQPSHNVGLCKCSMSIAHADALTSEWQVLTHTCRRPRSYVQQRTHRGTLRQKKNEEEHDKLWPVNSMLAEPH